MARPREFDEAEVLDKAMEVFCAHGYEGASMSALTSAMGLTAPSLYAAFGSKRGLFDAVLNQPASCQKEDRERVLSAPTAHEAALAWLLEAARNLPLHRSAGALLILGGLSVAPGNSEVPGALAKVRRTTELALWDRFEQAKASNDLPRESNPAILAAFITTVFHGMIVRAAAGAATQELEEIARQAMSGWPR